MRRWIISLLVPIFGLGSVVLMPPVPAMAGATNDITFANTPQEDGGCLFTVSFTWNGYGGGSNDALVLSVHSTVTDTSGTRDVVIGTQPFSPVSGHDGIQTLTVDTTTGAHPPVVAIAPYYGEAVLSSKLNGQGLGRTLVKVDSEPLDTGCVFT